VTGKIDSLSGAPTAVGTGHRPGSAQNATASSQAEAGSAGTPTADVHITDSASLLAGLAQQLSATPAVNEARVAQLRTAIESGSYTVQSGHVAAQLLQFERSLAQIGAG
jgi:negative regulator of flagellin synthesis FlgM